MKKHLKKSKRISKKQKKKQKKSVKNFKRKTTGSSLVRKRMVSRMVSHFGLNPNFTFFEELRNLVLKSLPSSRDKMVKRIASLGRVKFAVISGVFLNLENPSAADLLIVGEDIDRRRFRIFLRDLESEVGKEIDFSVMNREEFEYRQRMFDRFLRVLLEGPHDVLIDKIES